ncbi:hypothetical protein IJH97_02520 [Candidatus Saccharibacteria bacterium]|nr:hypothetical protein [Candidatus Saccharibacteria bacterium]
MTNMQAWLDDNELWENNPLKPDMAVQMLSKDYNVRLTIESTEWQIGRQSGWRSDDAPGVKVKDVEKIKSGLMKIAVKLQIPTEAVKKIWLGVKPFLENPAFVRFVLDAHAYESEFFYSWLSCVPRSITLEAHFGYAPDLTGTFREVPRSDPFWYWTQADPGLNLVGYRFSKTQALLADKAEILDLASGWFQWLRHGNYKPAIGRQVIYSCDLDPTAMPDYVLKPSVAGCTLSMRTRAKLEQHHRTLDVGLMVDQMIAEGRKFDAVVAGGILSYMMDHYNGIVGRIVKNLLKPDGIFLHDLQLMHWCMKRDAAVFGWNRNESNIQLLSDEAEAEARVRYAFSGMKNVTYDLDFDKSNEEPLAVLVTAQRTD